jgi:hypothetical protein
MVRVEKIKMSLFTLFLGAIDRKTFQLIPLLTPVIVVRHSL